MFAGIGLISFCCIFGAGVAGLLLRKILPEDQRTDATQKTVQTMMNVVAILAALVLGLLIASTKTSFDTRNKEIEQFSANLTLLDRELMHLGQEQKDRLFLAACSAHIAIIVAAADLRRWGAFSPFAISREE